jgi:hypothetical protein
VVNGFRDLERSKNVQLNIAKEVAVLRRMTTKQLRARYAEVFGELTQANNKAWLVKRIAWRLQVQAEGDLSERARRRAAELASEADLRLSPPKIAVVATPAERTTTEVFRANRDGRLPPPGSVITRVYKGETLQVKALANEFEFEGQVYRSLSAVAKAISGQHCNGMAFFRLSEGVVA